MYFKLLAASAVFFMPIQLIHAKDEELKSKDAINAIQQFETNNERLKRAYLDERDKLDAKHMAIFNENRSELLAALQAALEVEAKAINLEEANNINRILMARKAIESKLPDLTINYKSGQPSLKRLPDTMLGDWHGNWGTTGNRIELHLTEAGDSNYGKVTFQNHRILLMERSSEYAELIPHNDKILILGYSRNKGRHPLSTLPNHIGLLSRKN